MRRLAPIIYAIVFFDALLMFAIVPMLPDYVDALSLSKTQAGAVIGIYSAATLVVSLPAGPDRRPAGAAPDHGRRGGADDRLDAGLRRRDSFWMLLAARGGQGVASAISWTAGLAWLSYPDTARAAGRALAWR